MFYLREKSNNGNFLYSSIARVLQYTLKATFTAWKRGRKRGNKRYRKRELCAAIPFLCFLLPSFPPLPPLLPDQPRSHQTWTLGLLLMYCPHAPQGTTNYLPAPLSHEAQETHSATVNPHLPCDQWCWKKRVNDNGLWQGGESLCVPSRPENVYIRSFPTSPWRVK